ncbi:MAG: glycosyltransferase, partial [Chthoniobacteraceae bacterium]
AIAIIQPSLFEGWSTVVEDARALGRPCLLSDLGVHREQNPPGAHFFPPHSAEALADLMAEAWENWPAGPDAVAEAAARQRVETRLVEVGRRFLEIAARTQGLSHP